MPGPSADPGITPQEVEGQRGYAHAEQGGDHGQVQQLYAGAYHLGLRDERNGVPDRAEVGGGGKGSLHICNPSATNPNG